MQIALPFYAIPRDLKVYRPRWFTFSNEVKTIGPALQRESSEEYTRLIFRKIIESADKLAKEFYQPTENSKNHTYYSFLIAAMAVPLHESSLNHFRYTSAKNCIDDNNQMLHPRLQKSAKSILTKYYRDEHSNTGVLLPNCDYFNDQDNVMQAFSSGDFSDYGFMQLNSYYHGHMLYPEYYLNLYNSIEYGASYLYNAKTPKRRGNGGFRHIRQQIDGEYKECNFRENPYTDKQGLNEKIYYRLIIASWDRYNQGNHRVKSVCRYHFNPENKFSSGFKRALDSIVLNDSSPFNKYLPADSLERQAFNEILHNFKAIYNGGKEKNTALRELLNQTVKQTTPEFKLPERNRISPTHEIAVHNTVLYKNAKTSLENMCGTIDIGSKIELKPLDEINAFYNSETGSIEILVPVRVPKHSQYTQFFQEQPQIILKNNNNYMNVRSNPGKAQESEKDNTLFKWNDTSLSGKLLQKENNYGFLEFSDGRKGWVQLKTTHIEEELIKQQAPVDCFNEDNSFYIKLNSLNNLNTNLEIKSGQIAIGYPNVDVARVRMTPSLNGEDTKKRVYANQPLIILDSAIDKDNRLWYSIKTIDPEQNSGWTSAELISIGAVLSE